MIDDSLLKAIGWLLVQSKRKALCLETGAEQAEQSTLRDGNTIEL